MVNCSPNGVRFGVISFNALKDWCNEDLFYGNQARDLSWEAAVEELKAEARAAYGNYLEQAHIAAAEVDHGMGEEDHGKFLAQWFDEQGVEFDEDDFISDYVERNAEILQIDEPIIEGELDGVQYRISWLGGAPLVFLCGGLQGWGRELCSPCVPGAVQGDAGFSEVETDDFCYPCYIVPKEWLRDE
jgi:hypothetical protein